MRIFKVLLALVVVLAIGLIAYAYLGDMDSIQQQMRVPINRGGSGGS